MPTVKYRTLINGYILTREAADILQVSVESRRVNKLAKAGKIRYRMRDARTMEVNLRDVLAYAASDRKPGRPFARKRKVSE